MTAEQKIQRIKSVKSSRHRGSLLREEGRRGTVVAGGIVEPAGAEPHPAVAAEVEERRAREAAIGLRIVFISRKEEMELFQPYQPVGMRKKHCTPRECAEPEFMRQVAQPRTTMRSPAVEKAKLRPHHQVFPCLFFRENLLGLHRALFLTQILETQFPIKEIGEIPAYSSAIRGKHPLEGFTVSFCNPLPLGVHVRIQTFGTNWASGKLFQIRKRRGAIEVEKAELKQLFEGSLLLKLRRINIVRRDFLVCEKRTGRKRTTLFCLRRQPAPQTLHRLCATGALA